MRAGLCCIFVLFSLAVPPMVSAADVVTDWNQRAEASIAEAKQSQFVATRAMAIVHTAMFDAINSIEGFYTPYKFKVSAPPGSSPEAAGIAAAHGALVKLFPEQKTALDAAYADSLAKIAENPGKAAGIAVGEEVAARVIAWRASDGADAPNTYRPMASPGTYITTSLPVGSQWGAVTPWMMERGSQFRPGPPPPLTSAEWAADYNEVKELGDKKSARRSSEQSDIARFWVLTGPSMWDPLVRQLAMAPGRSLSQNARLFALVEMATADSYIAVFDAKYTFNFWRPITAIRNGDMDGNDVTTRDASWEPLVETPLHPEYPCAHCINAMSATVVLESEFGTGDVSLTMTSSTAPGVVRKWSRIRDYAEEISAARIYGGLHYRNSTMVGKAMGKKIGELAVQNYLKPVR